MELREYIAETLCSVMQGVKDADAKLQDLGLGRVWRDDFNTISTDLINVGIAKVRDPKNDKLSIPVLIFQFDTNVFVEDTSKSKDSAEVGAGGKALHIFSFTGNVKGESEKALIEKSVQNLRFSIPVSMQAES